MKKIVLLAVWLQAMALPVLAQTETKKALLDNAAADHRQKELKNLQHALKLAKEKGWEASYISKDGNIAFLVGVDQFGLPIYYTTVNNVVAAATIRTNVLWPGGSSGLNLSGNTQLIKDKMAIWDGGAVMPNHVELNGRVLQKDNPSGNSDHATHVAGTMIATGVNPIAKGMSYGMPRISAYDFNGDVAEIFSEASNLLLSNHSYSTITGWRYNDAQNRWEFWGRSTDNEDYKFGYYDTKAQLMDSITYNSPYYLPVVAAGNSRNVNGPAVGQPYWRYNASGTMAAAGNRPAGIYSNDGYDIISTYATAKNILTVGAVTGLPYGYGKNEDVVLSSFTGFGPTDDGRIKPDVVANGVDVLSPTASTTTSYSSFSGTSMATPGTTGSLLLLQQYWAQLHGNNFMRSATLKGLTIHTADEAGDAPGPDYRFGWGLVNVGNAAEVIRSNNTGNHQIHENVLNSGASFTTNVIASGNGPLVVTIAWTDPKGPVDFADILDNPAKKLVNDLDLRVTKGSTTYMPWKLLPTVPDAAATKGDNELDNVERINIPDAVPGETYTITITHKNILERGSQAYSLIISGVGGTTYCSSAASSSAGARINNFTLGTINNNNPSGCTTYTDFTNLSTSVEAGQSLPFTVAVGSCDATANGKIVKIFADFNNDGDFTDANELLATSNVIAGTGTFGGNLTIPNTVSAGNTARLRVVAVETNDAASVTPCGSYANGETQDYRITFRPASNDIAIIDLVSPVTGSCNNSEQQVTIRIRNVGTVDKTDIPLTVLVKNGTTLVAALNATYPGTIPASGVGTYTFQSPFNSIGGTMYNFEIFTSDLSDKNRANDTLRTVVTIAEVLGAPTAAAVVCGNIALLKVTNPDPVANYFWYTSPTGNQSVASGFNANTTTIPANNTYYVGTGARGNVGPANNGAWGNGGGYLSGTANYMKYSASMPVILESAKLYTKAAGKVDFIVADIISQSGTGFTYSAISTTTIDVYPTSPNPAPGTQNGFDPTDNGADFLLNLFLPAGDHVIIVRPQGNANIFRNNNVTGNPYPFSMGNLISFTGNGATQAGDPNYYQSFYYYLYNMKVRTADCMSARATVVAPVAPTPSITMEGDSLVSSVNSGNQWYRDNVSIAGATGKKHKPVESGNYTVRTSDALGCQRTSAPFSFIASAVNPVDNASIELSVSPNPSNGNFALKFKAARRGDMRIDIMNALGQSVYSKSYPAFSGQFSEQMQLRKLNAGVYVLKLEQAGKTYFSKIVIE